MPPTPEPSAARNRLKPSHRAVASIVALAAVLGPTAACLGSGASPPTPAPSRPPTSIATATSPSSPPPAAQVPTATSPSSPSPASQVPIAAMLTPSDVDPGDALAAGEVHGDWSLGFFGSICERFLETPDPGSAIPLAFREQQITGPVAVIQAVSVHPPDGAASLMRHARRLVHDCATIEHETSRWSLAIVESGFAGAESMMVQVTPLGVGGVGTHLYALIRQGDAVTEIRFEHSTAAQRRSIAAAAAGRLCAATTTC